jgi:ribosome maturation factor RimP
MGRDSQRLAESVQAIAAPIVRALGLELVDVECAGQGARTVLRVFIDKPGGVSVGDCEQVHHSLGRALDVQDPIPHPYTLEVSSPGLDRPLRRPEDYRRAAGKRIVVRLRQPVQGQWRLAGRLQEAGEPGVTLTLGRADQEQTVTVGWGQIVEARLDVTF